MNNTPESIQKDIANDFALADLLSDLIKANIQRMSEVVVAEYPEGQQHLDCAKVGCYEAWVNRLCGMLTTKDRDYLLQLLQNQLDMG